MRLDLPYELIFSLYGLVLTTWHGEARSALGEQVGKLERYLTNPFGRLHLAGQPKTVTVML